MSFYAPVSCPNFTSMTASVTDILGMAAMTVFIPPPYASVEIGGAPRGRVDVIATDVVGHS